MSKKAKTQTITIHNPKPILRTLVTHTNFKKYQGCIYFSTYDQTSQILLILKAKTGDSIERFSKNPIYFFAASSKIEIDSKISQSVSSLLNLKKPLESRPVTEEINNIYMQSA